MDLLKPGRSSSDALKQRLSLSSAKRALPIWRETVVCYCLPSMSRSLTVMMSSPVACWLPRRPAAFKALLPQASLHIADDTSAKVDALVSFRQTAIDDATRRPQASSATESRCVSGVLLPFTDGRSSCADIKCYHYQQKPTPCTMAVPFSRPAYPDHRRSSRRPQAASQQPAQHPITRFLDGRGGIRLDQLSLTSRIAFYALYEAYRLLMDLTNGQPQQPQQPQTLPVHTVVHVPTMSTPSTSQVLPDVVADSTQSAPRGPIIDNGQQSVAATKADLPDVVQDETDHSSSHHHDASLPDFLYEVRYNRQDLELKSRKNRSISTSSDYFSMDGSIVEEDHDFDLDEADQEVHKKCQEVNSSNVNWHHLGDQLCQIASAFEVAYAPAMDPRSRQLYQVYRDLKLRTLALSRRDQTMMGLAKTICRQVLLSSIWIILKKIM